MNPTTRKNISYALVIGILAALLVCAMQAGGLLQRLEWISYDWRMAQTQATAKLDPNVVVVLIDDASLKTLEPIAGRWPWPRSIYADLLDFLAMGEPKAVLFDITFSERALNPDGSSTLGEDDQRLVEATQQYPFVYHAARLLHDTADDGNSQLLNRPLPAAFPERLSMAARLSQQPSNFSAPSNNTYYAPFPELLDVTTGIGIVDVNSDADGVYRRARLLHRYGEHFYPALSTTAWLNTTKPGSISQANHAATFGNVTIPLDRDEQYMVKFFPHYETYSIAGLLASMKKIQDGDLTNLLVDPAEFKNKTVFIGASAAGLEDLKNTPIDARLPGVLIHASIAANILSNDFLRPVAAWVTYVGIFGFAIITALWVMLVRLHSLRFIVPAIAAVAIAYAGLWAFSANWAFELVPPLLALGLSWLGGVATLVFTESKEKRKFRRMMGQYLSPAVLASVMKNRDDHARAEIGTQERVTVMFSDIRSFTQLSEQLPPEQVVDILNHYFSAMTNAIFAHQGTIDKFIGDAIMAFWGAPLRIEDHAHKATLAALAMQERLKDVNAWLAQRQLAPLSIGIGLHTGEVILGNIGSEHKLDYTIIGDNVNLGSRTEGLTKNYGCTILITETTFNDLGGAIPCRLVDLVRVKGKNHPVRIYEPLIHPATATPEQVDHAKQIAALAEHAFQCYLDRDWPNALIHLSKLPDDGPTHVWRERCERFLALEPDQAWDGVFVMDSK